MRKALLSGEGAGSEVGSRAGGGQRSGGVARDLGAAGEVGTGAGAGGEAIDGKAEEVEEALHTRYGALASRKLYEEKVQVCANGGKGEEAAERGERGCFGEGVKGAYNTDRQRRRGGVELCCSSGRLHTIYCRLRKESVQV